MDYIAMVDGAGQAGGTLIVRDYTGPTPRLAGSPHCNIEGCFLVHSQSGEPLPYLQIFDLQGGPEVFRIHPGIIPDGKYKNISNPPANGARVLEA